MDSNINDYNANMNDYNANMNNRNTNMSNNNTNMNDYDTNMNNRNSNMNDRNANMNNRNANMNDRNANMNDRNSNMNDRNANMSNRNTNINNNNVYMNNDMCQGTVYVIKDGDSLYSIAKRYGLKVRDIMRNNPYVEVYNLQIGEEICLPTINGVIDEEEAQCYSINNISELFTLMREQNLTFDDLVRYNRNLANIKVPVGTVVCVYSRNNMR